MRPEPSAMSRAELEEILQLTLETGVRVQMSGGDTTRVYETIDRVARGLGAEQVEPSLSSTTLHLTVHRGGWSRTAMRHMARIGINFAELTELSRLSRRVDGMSIDEYRAELHAISPQPKRYPTLLSMVMLGVACGGLAALFGADAPGIVIAGVTATAGAWIRHLLAKARFQPFIFAQVAAFVTVALVLLLQSNTSDVSPVLAGSVLYLIPGVPLLNGTSDLLNSQSLNGVVRLTATSVMLLGSAIGISVAILLGHLL